ncbi:hypothetical protein D9M71_104940 [compost metagenome]
MHLTADQARFAGAAGAAATTEFRAQATAFRQLQQTAAVWLPARLLGRTLEHHGHGRGGGWRLFDDHRIGVRSPAQGGRAEGFGVNPRIANVQLAQAVVQRLGKTPGTADHKIRLIVVLDCQQILEQRDVDPSTEVEVLSLYRLGFRLTEQTHYPHRVTGILEQAIQFAAKWLVGQRARTLDEPCGPDTAGA